MLRMADRLPQDREIDIEDLGNVYGRARIQSCNAGVSTSRALCVWPCNCYEPENKDEPDLMWDLDLYARLDLADAWAIIGPVNCAFFCYGDGGGDELNADGRPKALRHPEYFDAGREPFEDGRNAFAPLAWQCRYSGIEVPEALWTYSEFGKGRKYSDNQAEHMIGEEHVLRGFDAWTDTFAEFVHRKGKVPPGPFRAFGTTAPSHRMADLRLKWRELRMGLGVPVTDSSPARQQALGLNRDATLRPARGEGEKLRDE